MEQPGWYAPPAAATNPAPPEQVASEPAEPAGFGIRAGAHIIDTLITFAVALVAGTVGAVALAVLATMGVVPAGWEQRVGQTGALAYAFSMLGSLAYHTLGEGLGGATAGKAICGLRVLTEEQRPCTVPKALGRNLAYYIDALFFGAVAWSSMSKSPMQQRYGDRWAKTIVVHTRSVRGVLTRGPAVGIVVSLLACGTMHLVSTLIKGF